MPRVRPKELQTLETLERNWPACPIGTTVSSARHRFNNFLISPLFSFYSFFSTPDGQKPINATGFFNVFYCGTSISSPAFLLSSFLSIISLLYFVWFDCAVMQSPWRLIQLRPGTLLRYVGFLSPNMLFSLSLSLGFGVTAHAVVFLSARISFLAASRAAFDVMERGLTLIPIDISSRQDSSYTHRRFDTQVTSLNI